MLTGGLGLALLLGLLYVYGFVKSTKADKKFAFKDNSFSQFTSLFFSPFNKLLMLLDK